MAQTRNVTMRNLRIVSRNWCIGSATFGGVYDILFEDSTIGDPDMVRAYAIQRNGTQRKLLQMWIYTVYIAYVLRLVRVRSYFWCGTYLLDFFILSFDNK